MGTGRPRRRTVLLIAALLCFAVAGACAYVLIGTFGGEYSADRAFREMARQTDGATGRVAELHAENPDCVAWIEADGTNISYPVMYTPHDPEYYLHRNFDKEQSASGTPFIGANAALSGNSLIVYGHHMSAGTMFAQLLRFDDAAFGRAHRLRLSTDKGTRVYEVFAAFYEDLSKDGYYRYWDEVGQLGKDAFEAHVAKLEAQSLYRTDAAPVYGQRIIMLSTCSYGTSEQRFCVCGVEQ